MEFGVAPGTMSGVALSMLGSLRVIVHGTSTHESNATFSATQRLVCLVFTAYSASYAIATVHYGTFEELSLFQAACIFLQRMIAGILVLVLDELVEEW
jgi:preprotein translocase subunit SecY